jgi:uncharacterized membrane protein YgaE (UPF0421/DUF939 family)
MGLLLGVATGIVVGELSLLLPDTLPLLRIVLASFFAMLVASAYGQSAVVAIGPATTGSVRMIDVAVGAAVGLVISLILTDRQHNNDAKPQRAAGDERDLSDVSP